MLYVLLIIPHLVAVAGLLAYALQSAPIDAGEDDGPESGSKPPLGPSPRPPVDHMLLPEAVAPRRRMRGGERLSDLHPPRSRRERPVHQPSRLGASDVR